MPINIICLESNDYSWQKLAQINAFWSTVFLIDGSIWMHENEVQSITFLSYET